jgi:hypothetical protein
LMFAASCSAADAIQAVPWGQESSGETSDTINMKTERAIFTRSVS